ncbi:MAG: hypothetical protein ACI9CD_000838 [Candidatus Deianiraeaceae bacterium]|jgi:hypothetical protein
MQKGTEIKDIGEYLNKLKAKEHYDGIKPIIGKIQGNLTSVFAAPNPVNYPQLVQLCKYIDPEINLAIRPLTSDCMKLLCQGLAFECGRTNVNSVLHADDVYNKKEELTQTQFLAIYAEKGWQSKMARCTNSIKRQN